MPDDGALRHLKYNYRGLKMGILFRLLACLTLCHYTLSNYNEQVYHERNCPTDWRYFDYKCYHVTSALTFQAARKYCRDHGADIVVYDYKMEIGLMQQMQPGVDSWVGLQIQDGEAEHTWFDGKRASETYTRWGTDQPDGGSSNSIAYLSNKYLYDSDNTTSKVALCEKRADTGGARSRCASQEEIRSLARPITHALDADYSTSLPKCSQTCLLQLYSYAALIDGNCVCMSEEPDDSTCTNSLSDDLKVYYEFTTLTVPDDFNITVSQLSNMDCARPSHTYYNGKCYIYEESSKHFFDHLYEARQLYGEDATLVSFDNEAEARFVDEVLLSSENRVSDSDDKTFFIGVYDDRNVCDKGWTPYDGACFYYPYNGTNGTRDEMRAFCQGMHAGADLIWFEDSFDQSEAMKHFMPEDHESKQIDVWSGLYNTSEGWVYPMFGNQAGHHEFSSGYESPRGRCSMMRSNEGYKMRDVLCTDSYEAVCRYNVRDRDAASFVDFINMDGVSLSESYSRWYPGEGYGQVPYCAYYSGSNKFWYQTNCQHPYPAIYEYPAILSNYSTRGGLVSLLAADDVVDAFTKVEAIVTHDGGPVAENSVSFSDGDGQFDWDKSFTTFSHDVTQLGDHEVVFDSMDFWYQRSNGSATYQVVLPVEGSNVICPLLVDTTYEMECEVAATGQSPSSIVSFGDKSPNITVQLPGSSLKVVGPDLRQETDSSGQAINGNSYAMFNSRFSVYGLVQAFEFDAVQPGDFHFVIWRPKCEDEEVFCYKSMACHPIEYKFDPCENVTNWHAVTCGAGSMWSLSERACVNDQGERIAETNRYFSNMDYDRLENVGEHLTSTSRRGRHFIRLKREEMIEVQPGDVLGFISLNGKLADVDVGKLCSSYSSSMTKTEFPESGSATDVNYEFFLNAHLSTYSHLLVPHQYLDVGPKNVSQETTNSLAVTNGFGTRGLIVYERVRDLEIIDVGAYGRAIIRAEIEEFQVNVHEGDPVTYEWDFADGTELLTETNGTVTHAFAEQGRYNVTVRAYNELSEDLAWTWVLVQAPIRVGTPTQYDNSTRLGVRSVFKYCIDDGNEVTYSITVTQLVYGLPHPGYSVFELDSAKCSFGFDMGESKKCFLPTDSAVPWAYDDSNACYQNYNRSFPAHYESLAAFQAANAHNTFDGMFSGFHIGASGGWYNWYGQEMSVYPHFGSFAREVSGEECVTYSSDGTPSTRDCNSPAHMMCMYEGDCETFSIELPQIGVYDVRLKAENEVTSVEHNFTQYVETPIEGLTIHAIPSQRWGDTIMLSVTWTSGSRLHAVCYNSLDESGETCDDFDWSEDIDGGPSSGTITVRKSEYKYINDHHRFIKFHNMISSMTATQTFTVMYEIESMALANDHHPCAITKEDLVTYTLTFDQMSHCTVTWSFADQTSPGTDTEVYIDEITNEDLNYPAQTSKMFSYDISHKYPVEGNYTITVNVSNDLSFATMSRLITIENPIRGYRYEKTSPVPLWPGQIARVNITLIFDPDLDNHINDDKGKNLIPTDVTQYYRYGTPDCSQFHDVNECNDNNGGCDHICVNLPGTYQCSCNADYYLDYDGKTCLYGNGTHMTTAAPLSGTNTTTGAPPPAATQAGRLTTADMWKYLGQTCPEGTHTEMINVTETQVDIDYFDYTHYGTFDVVLYYQNCISDQTFTFTVDIDQPVMNLTIVSDEYILPWSANSTLTVEMDWGSRINLTYNFDDTNPNYEAVYDRLYPNFIGHQWDVEGTFYPTITAVNLIDTYIASTGPIYIQYILADALRVETPYIWTIPYPNYWAIVAFDVFLKQEYVGMMPTNVTANVTFGEWNPVTNSTAVLNDQYLPVVAHPDSSLDYGGDKHAWRFTHNYTVGDTYNVTIDFINWVSALSIDVEFHAIEEVAPLTLHPMILDEDRLEIEDEAIDWSFPLHFFADCEQLMMSSSQSCMYALREAGAFSVPADSAGTPADPLPAPTLYDSYYHLPTNESIRPRIGEANFLAYLDGTNHLTQEELRILVTDSLNIRSGMSPATQAQFDRFLVLLEMYPPLTVGNISMAGSALSYVDDVAYRDWMVRQQWAYDKQSVIDALDPGFLYQNDAIFSYPVEKAVTVYISFARGTHYSVFWDWGDSFTEITDLPFASHRYERPGLYLLSVTVFNSISKVTITEYLNLQRTITNLTFVGPDIVTRNHTNKWTFDLGSIGTDACYLVNFKDTGTPEYPTQNRYFFFGLKTACNDYFKKEMSVFPQQGTWLTNEANEKEVATNGAMLISEKFLFGSLGTYRVTFTGRNRVSAETFLMPIAVTKGPCFRPLVRLREENPCEPICDNGEKVFYRSSNILLRTAISYNCTTTDLGYHDWHIYTVHDNGSESEITLINQTLYSSYDEFPVRKLKIAPLSLDYGRYKVTLNVTMYDEDVWKEDIMYFIIARSPLKSGINGEVSKIYEKFQWKQVYTLDAASYTIDPDNPLNRTGFTYVWRCRRFCETMEELDELGNVVVPASSICNDLNNTYRLDKNGVEDRGCFVDDGFGIGEFTNSTEGIVSVDLTYAIEFDLIQFFLDVYKDNLHKSLAMYLEITEEMPPQINPRLCVSNCKDKVNSMAIFSLECKIAEASGVYGYKWILYRGLSADYNDPSTVEVPPTEWNKNLPADGSKTTMVQTGNVQQSFALEPGFFTIDDTSYYFFVVALAWAGDKIHNAGVAMSMFQVNEPPEQGNCTVYPLNGTAGDTKFNVECTDFYDQHQPVLYQTGFRVIGTVNINWGPWRTFANDAAGGTVFGEGDPQYDYMVEVFVRAQDYIGGKTMSTPQLVKVLPADMDMSYLTVTVLASGDPLEASAKIIAYAYRINAEVKERLTTEAEQEAAAAAEAALALSEEEQERTVLGEDGSPRPMTEEELLAEELEKQEEAARWAKRGEKLLNMRERLAIALDMLPLDSLELISVVNQAASVVAALPEELTEIGIRKLSNMGHNSVGYLEIFSVDMDSSLMNEKCTEVISSQVRVNTGLAYFVSTLVINNTDEEVIEERRRKRAAAELTLDDLKIQIEETQETCSNLVSHLKVPGEGDTVLVTDTSKTAVMKKYKKDFAGGQMASTGSTPGTGVALPPGDQFLGAGNDSLPSAQSVSNSYEGGLPQRPPGGSNNTEELPSGQVIQLILGDPEGKPLNLTFNDTVTTHNFLTRPDPPQPIVVIETAAPLGEKPVIHKLDMPAKSSLQATIRQYVPPANESVAGNSTNTTSTTTTTPSPGRRKRSVNEVNPFLPPVNNTGNYSIFDDLLLVFDVIMKMGARPSVEDHDFSCILPVRYFSLSDNTTVAVGGTVRDNVDCTGLNGTCDKHALNRELYPLDKDITEGDQLTCFIPDTWLNSFDATLELFVGLNYYYINRTFLDGLENVTYEQFAAGYMPELVPVEIPADQMEPLMYEMEVSSSSCKYWSPFDEDYISDGCEVGPLTTLTQTHCICNSVVPPVPAYNPDDTTMPQEEYERRLNLASKTPGITFGGKLSLPVNTIDLSNSAFNNLGENPLVFSLMVSIMCLYLCCLIWAHAEDRKDAVKAGVSPLLDNDPRDKYLYEVTIYTGTRTGSSTTAKVSMIFSGEEDETPPRLIFDDKRPVLQSGGVDGFIMATPRSLGSLSHIRVWHDNSGKSPGWFFSRMQMVDMQTLEKYFFILDRWLSAGEDDGIIDRIVPLAGKDELTGFSHLFFTRARKDLMDGHIWFSIYGKPHKSNFTRCQRLTCCLCLLFASMTSNIFLYNPDAENTGTSFRIGPISMTLEQILYGCIASLMVFPINILIVLIFKYSKEPPYDWKKRCCSCCKRSRKKRSANSFAADELAHQAKILDGGHIDSRAVSFASLGAEPDEDDVIQEYLNKESQQKNKKFKLPWGFIFVAYILCLAVVGVSFWYTVEVAGTFGPTKAAEWTASFFTSIIESIFLSQPLKVLGIALFYALVIKKPDSDEDVDPGLEKGEEYLHKHEKQCQKLDHRIRKRLNKYKNIPLPPTEEYLAAARALRQKELKMIDVLKEIFFYVVFVNLLMMVSYGNRDPRGHILYKSLYDEFHDASYFPSNGVPFTKVSEYNSFWAYCNQTLLPTLWSDTWYDGKVRDSHMIVDRNTFRVGVPRLRQLRMHSEECGMPMYRYTKECNQGYNIFTEDTGNYYPGWIPVANESAVEYEGPYPGWFWESSADLEGFPFRGMTATYGGGGFNIELGYTLQTAQETLNNLREMEWLTPETRAVVIEFVLYNANMNLFAVSSMTFEFLNTGSVVPVYKMNLIRLDRYIGSYMITVMVSEILTFLYIIYFFYREIKTFRASKGKYFKSFWNIVEFIMLMLCITAAIMFFCRFAFIHRTAKNFREQPSDFTSFQFASTWEEIYSYILSFIIFIATIKFLKLLRFNKKMTMLGMTMMYIGKPLLSFLLALGIVFFAFAQMAYLVYCRLLVSFSTFMSATTTLFTLMLNKFDYKALEEANQVFAPIIFFSFTILVSFVLLSFMITIILDGFMEVTEELKRKENEYEIVDFIVSKFKGAVGLGKGPDLPPMNRETEGMVGENHAELMDRFEDFEEMFREFCSDETRGEEPLVAKYEREILQAKKNAKNRTIYST